MAKVITDQEWLGGAEREAVLGRLASAGFTADDPFYAGLIRAYDRVKRINFEAEVDPFYAGLIIKFDDSHDRLDRFFLWLEAAEEEAAREAVNR